MMSEFSGLSDSSEIRSHNGDIEPKAARDRFGYRLTGRGAIMTELRVIDDEITPRTCPPWCATDSADIADTDRHTHASTDTRVDTLAHPLSVQLVQVGDAEPRLLIDGQVATIEQASAFASAIKRMTDAATLAEPGLSFVLRLAASAGIGLERMAAASGIDVDRLRAQRAGGQVMTVHEVDGLALTVANLVATRKDPALAEVPSR